MQISRRPITLKCNRPSATRRLARRSTSCARGHRWIFLLSLGLRGEASGLSQVGPALCVYQHVKDRGDMDSAGEAGLP